MRIIPLLVNRLSYSAGCHFVVTGLFYPKLFSGFRTHMTIEVPDHESYHVSGETLWISHGSSRGLTLPIIKIIGVVPA